MLSAREAALSALERCRRDGSWSGAAIDNIIKKYGFERRDAALACTMCLGVLQNSSYFDFLIDCYCSQKADKLEPKLRDILRLGIYQLLYLDKIPPRAAVNETVQLCRNSSFSRASGLVNAVLRRVAENRDNLPEVPGKGSAEYLSIKYSHPLWLCKRLCEEKSYDFAEAFLRCNNSPAGLYIQVNRIKISTKDYVRLLSEAGIYFEEDAELDGCLLLRGGNVSELPGFEEGLFYVQDKAARMAAELSMSAPGMAVLDACSAPGGKSFAAAIKMNNSGSIISCDIHEKKLSLIRSGADRLGIEIIKTLAADGRKQRQDFLQAFDAVIADVPCSGLGVISKKPEIRQKSEFEISSLPQIQLDILRNLSDYPKVGGCLVYSTCTVLSEENEAVVLQFLKENKNYRLEACAVCGVDFENGMRTFWPNTDRTDGFFAARLVRIN